MAYTYFLAIPFQPDNSLSVVQFCLSKGDICMLSVGGTEEEKYPFCLESWRELAHVIMGESVQIDKVILECACVKCKFRTVRFLLTHESIKLKIHIDFDLRVKYNHSSPHFFPQYDYIRR